MKIPYIKITLQRAIVFAIFSLFSVTAICQQKPYVKPFLPATWRMPSPQPDHIVLNFSDDPATTQSVTWRTDTSVTTAIAEIAIATGGPRFWRNAVSVEGKTERMDASKVKSAEAIANYHSATFTNLTPDTIYAYRVGDGQHWSEWIHFRTASQEAAPFSFLYVGDAQNNVLDLWSRLIRAGYSKIPDARFIIHAGDLINDAHSEIEWHEWFTAGGWIHRSVPSIPLPGNHEYEGYTEAEEENDIEHLSVQWRPQFTLPMNGPEGIEELEETTYYIDYQDVRIIVLNSNLMYEEQATWMEGLLADNSNRWTIVTCHHPMFSASGDRDNPELRATWKPLFDEYGVDLVLQGHDHSYARGHTAPTAATNVTDGINIRDAAGTVYVVSVSGGKMYARKPGGWEQYEASLDRAAENTQLFQTISIEGDTLQYRAYTAIGELYDAFDLIKGKEDAPNAFVERVNEAVPERTHENTIPYR